MFNGVQTAATHSPEIILILRILSNRASKKPVRNFSHGVSKLTAKQLVRSFVLQQCKKYMNTLTI